MNRLLLNTWTPRKLVGVLAWWDFSRLVGEVAPDGVISSVADRITGLEASGSGSNRPTLKHAAINGHAAAQFSAASPQYLSCNAIAAQLSGSDVPFSAFGVSQFTDASAVRTLFSLGRSTDAVPFHYLRCLNATQLSPSREDDAGVNAAPSLVTPSMVTGAFAWGVVFRGTTTDIYYNLSASSLGAAQNVGVATFDRFTIGALGRTTYALGVQGYIGELIVGKQAVDTATANRVIRYLMRHWGL